MAADQVIVENLSKRFGEFTAVDRVSFHIHESEIMGFIGPNGAGKSTLIRVLCGLLDPTEGRALVNGTDVAKNPDAVRQHIGYMSQKFSLYNDLSVLQNLRFFAGVYQVPRDRLAERLHFALDMAGLLGREDAAVSSLAGGWKQRLALSCAILHRPRILFLDEPTSGVDPASRRRFWDLIHALSAEGVTVLVSTHYMDEAEYCNRIALINRGALVAVGTPTELKQRTLGGQLVLVEAERLGPLLQSLRGAPGIGDVAVFGNALHVFVRDETRADDAVRAFLDGQKLAYTRVLRIEPSLEDVFVHLVTASNDGRRAA